MRCKRFAINFLETWQEAATSSDFACAQPPSPQGEGFLPPVQFLRKTKKRTSFEIRFGLSDWI